MTEQTMPTRTILSVDDEQDIEELLSSHFRKKIRRGEYHLLFARNGREGLQKLCAHPEVDVVLADINMPVMSGLAMLEAIGNESLPGQTFQFVKTIVVTAYGDMPNIRKAMNYGAFDFLTKPLDLIDLNLTIERAIFEAERLRKLVRQRREAEKNLESTNFLVDMGGTF